VELLLELIDAVGGCLIMFGLLRLSGRWIGLESLQHGLRFNIDPERRIQGCGFRANWQSGNRRDCEFRSGRGFAGLREAAERSDCRLR
jgi:hypothetical protein